MNAVVMMTDRRTNNMTGSEIRDLICGIVCMPLLLAVIWFYTAVGVIWEDSVRCDNGAIEFCK